MKSYEVTVFRTELKTYLVSADSKVEARKVARELDSEDVEPEDWFAEPAWFFAEPIEEGDE